MRVIPAGDDAFYVFVGDKQATIWPNPFPQIGREWCVFIGDGLAPADSVTVLHPIYDVGGYLSALAKAVELLEG